MPKDNIERAIAKGTGADQDAARSRRCIYEGYGPGGVAVLVEALTDNRNRTGLRGAARVLHGGRQPRRARLGGLDLREEGRAGGRRRRATREDDLIGAIDAGAEDVSLDGDVFEVVTAPEDFAAVRDALDGAGVELDSAELVMRPTTRTPVEEADAGRLMRLIDDARGARRRAGGPRELRRGRRGARARGRRLRSARPGSGS